MELDPLIYAPNDDVRTLAFRPPRGCVAETPGVVRPKQCHESVCILARTFCSPSGSFERPRQVP
jgi:hypothetical protein